MATLYHPLDSEQVSGSVGSTTYLRRGRGTIARPRIKHPYVLTAKRAAHAALLKDLIAYWQGMTPQEHERWGYWAKDYPRPNLFGGIYTLTPYAAFIARNILHRAVSTGYVYTPYPATPPPLPTVLELEDSDLNALTVSLYPSDDTLHGFAMDVWTQRLPNAHTRGFIEKATRLGVGFPNEFSTEFQIAYKGALQVWARYIHTSSGIPSRWLTDIITLA
jgi:hypothetical protein